MRLPQSVVEDGRVVLSSLVASQVDLHAQFGGVFPEVASRQHIRTIYPIIEQTLRQAHLSLAEVDAIAVTRGSGLPGSLVVGMNMAKALALASRLPLIGINHLEAHLYSAWIDDQASGGQATAVPEPRFPLLALIVSGGHSELVLMTSCCRASAEACSEGAAATAAARTYELLVEPRWSLAYVLRVVLGLTGTKVGCDRGECGACTVLLNGMPRYACLTLAVEAEGAEIVTVEGLLAGEDLGPVQQAFVEKDAFQCGYCTSGQIMAAEGLLRATGSPDVEQIRHGMSGNLCRCGAYPYIVQAVQRAAELRRQGGAS